ncbi:MAG: tetratricopeptide repeat protein [Planctomycetes bacterium]|nr:tetratricopeptide repeat protein [Planctomycetota bacterium]
MSDHLEHYKAGMASYGQGQYDAAIASFEEALKAKPEWTDAMHGLALALMHAEEFDRAIEVGKAIAEIDKEDPFAHTSLSMFYQRKSQIAEKAGLEAEAKELIRLAEEQGNKARLLSWKIELKTNPTAPPPGPVGSMDVIE